MWTKTQFTLLGRYFQPCVVYHCIPFSVDITLIVFHPFIEEIPVFLKRFIYFCRWNINDILRSFKTEFQTFIIAYYEVTISDPSVIKSLH